MFLMTIFVPFSSIFRRSSYISSVHFSSFVVFSTLYMVFLMLMLVFESRTQREKRVESEREQVSARICRYFTT